MSIQKLSLRAGAAALFATLAAFAAAPSIAVAAATDKPAIAQPVTDFSAARRGVRTKPRASSQRRAVRNAYGSYQAGSVISSGNYGYGVGDNARGQTW